MDCIAQNTFNFPAAKIQCATKHPHTERMPMLKSIA